jgi:hypothetical protein
MSSHFTTSKFQVTVNGSLEGAEVCFLFILSLFLKFTFFQLSGESMLFSRFDFVCGIDWEIIAV